MGGVEDNINFEKEYEDRPENLLKAYKNSVKDQEAKIVSLREIIMKSCNSRSSDDISHLMLHLMFKVPFFQSLKKKLIVQICEKLEFVHYTEGQNLMEQGEIGDKMFIIFSGKANVLIKNDSRPIVVATVKAN